jgi:hypothetical protein
MAKLASASGSAPLLTSSSHLTSPHSASHLNVVIDYEHEFLEPQSDDEYVTETTDGSHDDDEAESYFIKLDDAAFLELDQFPRWFDDKLHLTANVEAPDWYANPEYEVLFK